MTSPSQVPIRPPRTTHLRWLYLLIIIPILTDYVEKGALPRFGRELTSEVVMAIVVFLVVHVIIRRSEALVASMHAHIRSTEQLHHANRLATVGQLAAGIAHELGSPLQVVGGRGKMIATGETTGDSAKESGQIIVDQTKRMTQIIRGLLGFARRQPVQRTTTDLGTVAREVDRMLGPIAKKKAVELAIEIGKPRTVDVDSIQVQQALTNLVMNAIQAVPDGGHVTVLVDVQERVAPPDHVALQRRADCTYLRVTDDGPGIEEPDMERVFEPFFTTKDVGEGTGLGLAVAYGLVRENGGWITVESELGKGASFSIFFPCTTGQS